VRTSVGLELRMMLRMALLVRLLGKSLLVQVRMSLLVLQPVPELSCTSVLALVLVRTSVLVLVRTSVLVLVRTSVLVLRR